MNGPSRSIVVAMVPSGTIAGHFLGYLLSGREASFHGAHSHLRPAAWLAAAVTASALSWLVVVRTRGRGAIRWESLVSGQVALFGVVEAVEHAVAGHDALSFFAAPSFRWGLLAQLATAAVLVAAARLARASGKRARAVLSRRRTPSLAPWRLVWRALDATAPRRVGRSSVSERGPPRPLAAI